jgi:hypothetical protein
MFPAEVYCTEVNCVAREGANLLELYNSVVDSTMVHGCFTFSSFLNAG